MLKSVCERCHSDPFTVIPSEARNLALEAKDLRDSSSPAAPQNDPSADGLDAFFSILQESVLKVSFFSKLLNDFSI
jgi:hypothetical protein